MAINLGSSFGMQAALPLDDRTTFADLTARDAVPAGRLYAGLMCYVASEAKNYQWDGTAWVEFAGGGGTSDVVWQEVTAVGDITLVPTSEYIRIVGDGLATAVNIIGIAMGDIKKVFILNARDDSGEVKITNGGALLDEEYISIGTGGDLLIEGYQSAEFIFIDAINGWNFTTKSEYNKFPQGSIYLGDNTDRPQYDIGVWNGDGNPYIRYDNVEKKWKFSNDGSVLQNFGSGSGGTDILFVDDFDNSVSTDYFDNSAGMVIQDALVLNGTKSASISHDTTITTGLKRIYDVPRKFRGKNCTILADVLSAAGEGKVLLTITDETNTVVIVNQEVMQIGATTNESFQNRVSFDVPLDCFDLSYKFEFLADASGFYTVIDDVVCVLSDALVTSQALVQEEDSAVTWINGGAFSFDGSSIALLPTATVQGSGISIENTTHTKIRAAKSGVINLSATFTYSITASGGYLFVYGRHYSSTGVTKGAANVTDRGGVSGTGILNISYTGKFEEGDYFVFVNGSSASISLSTFYGSVTMQGSLKQVNVNSNQKMKIPTHELIMHGASARGSTATQIVKFDTVSKLKGSAFTITNTAADGTAITITKAGRLTVSANIYLATSSNSTYITKNQVSLTALPATDVEILSRAFAANSAQIIPMTWTGDVVVGDVIRIASTLTPTGTGGNNLSLSLQETEVQVSVSNTLPQYSESDLVVKCAGNAGQAITAGVTDVPFITVSDTTGGAWSGTQFTVLEDGVFDLKVSMFFTTATWRSVLLYVNGVAYKRIGSGSADDQSIQGSLSESFTKGQVLSFRADANNGTLGNNTLYHWLTITKVGKPNVTGVDVTPFVNIPYPTTQHLRGEFAASINSATNLNTAISQVTSGSGLFTVNPAGKVTILKKCRLNLMLYGYNASQTLITSYIYYNDVEASMDLSRVATTTSLYASASLPVEAQAGDTFYFTTNNVTTTKFSIVATAESDQIVTSLESFSTDSTPLTYVHSGQYTLASLSTAPVGTYTTFGFAANSNTRTQAGSGSLRPSQSDADMNANGIRIYTRPYNANSGTDLPCAFAIQIGKGLKSVDLTLFKDTTRVYTAEIEYGVPSSAVETGLRYRSYSPDTGILIVDAGTCSLTTNTIRNFAFNDITSQTNAYLKINASKNPAFAGVSTPPLIAMRYTSDSGTAIGATPAIYKFEDKVIDTHNIYNASTGVATIPKTGWYRIASSWITAAATYTTSQYVQTHIHIDGAVKSQSREAGSGTSLNTHTSVSDTLYLQKGQTVDIRIFSSVATTMLNDGNWNNFTITEVR